MRAVAAVTQRHRLPRPLRLPGAGKGFACKLALGWLRRPEPTGAARAEAGIGCCAGRRRWARPPCERVGGTRRPHPTWCVAAALAVLCGISVSTRR